ncbi:MAG: alpha/beta hydrolase-fold protein [Kiritimatiellae bacterium]|nr:alpha/beta hydrolase-fold protein [Kiritimatiellia bacterium]
MNKVACLAALAAFVTCHTFAASPWRETMGFSITTNVGYGNEVFVVGNHPDLGSWNPTRAAKLYWTDGNVWTGKVGIKSGETVDYKFVSLPNTPDDVCDPANANWMPPGEGTHSVTTAPAQPDAPYVGKTIYYFSSLTNITLIYSSAGGDFATAPMNVVGAGRQSGEFLYRVSEIGEAGERIEFVLSGMSGGNTIYDHAPYPGYGSEPDNNYFTTLDAFYLQDGNIFNYRPPATVSPSQIISSNAVSTFSPSPSRTMKIYLPRGYTENTWKRYPVIYMHDGENTFYPGGVNGSWDAGGTADREISQGRMRESIIVALNSTSQRTREYLPPEDNSGGAGFGDVYGNFLKYDVKAKIDAEFRTLPDRPNTATIGASSGGLIVTYLGWATNVFGLIGPFSPAYLISPNFNQRIANEPKQPLRIFTATGTAGDPEVRILPDTWPVLDSFLKKGYVSNVDLVSRIGCGQMHNEATWASWLPECFRFLLNIWDEPNRVAQDEHPPVITWASGGDGPTALVHRTLAGFRYELQLATNGIAGNWQLLQGSTPEVLPWSSRLWPLTNVPQSARTAFFSQLGELI